MYTVIWFVIAVLGVFAYVCEYIETCKVERELDEEREQNAKLYAKCEKLADENLRLEQAMREQSTKAVVAEE